MRTASTFPPRRPSAARQPSVVPLDTLGRLLIISGLVMAGVGALLVFTPAGRLPGDLALGSGNVRIYVPIATSILLSVVLTLVLNFLARR